MFKNINQYFLTRYPLLWNTRIYYVLPAAVIIHLLFYINGFLYRIPMDEIVQHHHFNITLVITLSVLVSAILIILWLVFYLRNNPFKTYYTLSKNYLFAEFLLIFLVFISSTTFFLSYRQGLYDRLEADAEGDITKEIDAFNLSGHFLAYNYDNFDIDYACDSLIANGQNYAPQSVERPNRNFSSKEADLYNKNAYNHHSEGSEKSYLFYCDQVINRPELPLKNKEELNQIAVNWLMNRQKDSVLQLLKTVTAMCQKYGVAYSIDPRKQVNECFSTERFTVNELVLTSKQDFPNSPGGDYLEVYQLQNALEQIADVKKGFWQFWMVLVIIYTSLGASIVLFSYRITQKKNWFIALVGNGIWAIVIGLIAGLMQLKGQSVLIIPVLLFAAFAITTLLNVNTKTNKLFSGISLNWSFWLMPFLMPILWAGMIQYERIDCYNPEYIPECTQTDFYYWLQDHWDWMSAANAVFILLAIYLFIIPLARRWQANPEE